jgi:hypothetical protein
MSQIVQNQYSSWQAENSGKWIYNGFIYVGQVDLDPEIEANQVRVYYIDESGQEIDLQQPIRTNSSGFPVISATNSKVIQVRVDGDYSVKVLNKKGVEEWYTPKASTLAPVFQIDSTNVLNDDGLTAQDTHDATKANLISQGLSGNYGFFEKGFNYVNVGDVGIDTNNQMWLYVGAGAPVKNVVAGTVPSDPDYVLFNLSRFSNVLEISAGKFSIGDYINVTDRGNAIFNVKPGGTANGFNIIDAGNGNTAELVIENGEFNVTHFGAVGSGLNSSDDAPAINAASSSAVDYANSTGFGATIVYPPLDYFIKSPVSILPSGENSLDRYNQGQAGTLTTEVKNITIRGYGARVICETSSFIPEFPFFMMSAIEHENVHIRGLVFESDLNNKIPNWIDSSNYFNRAAPTVSGEGGFAAIRGVGFKFIDCPVRHCEIGLIITDDRTFTIPTPDPMLTYRSEVRGCDFYNCWQLMSMTYGATEELIIHTNTFRYGFIKLVQESDQGRAVLITNNTLRDISGILTNTNDSQITSNTFNNLLGGIRLQPQGGSNPSTDYNYDLINTLIKDNTCYSDHMTEVDGEALGSGTDLPSQFLSISATTAATAGQTVNVENLRVEGNTAVLWGRGGTSTGAVFNRDGDAMINFKSASITGKNKFTIKGGATATVCVAPAAAYSNTTLSGVLDISDNEFIRENASTAFEFQTWFASSEDKAVVKFNDNVVTMPESTNRFVTVGGVRNFRSKNNEYDLGTPVGATSALYWLAGVTNFDIEDNHTMREGSAGNVGYIVYHDGLVSGTYDAVMEKGKGVVRGNTINVAQFVFNSAVSFPTTSLSFFDLFGNTISTNTTTDFQTYPSITGFNAYNVVNPHVNVNPPTAGIPLVPPYFVLWNGSFTTGTPTGWRYNGVNWREMGTNP